MLEVLGERMLELDYWIQVTLGARQASSTSRIHVRSFRGSLVAISPTLASLRRYNYATLEMTATFIYVHF